MATARYELHIKHEQVGEDSSLVLAQFAAIKSQFDNPPDQINLSIKPKSLRAKLEVGLIRDSVFFSKENAKNLVDKSVPGTFEGDLADKNFYSSTKTTIDDDQLFVGKIVDDKLVCRPVSQILTFRPDFTHFDLKDEVDFKDEVKPVSVKFSAPDRQGQTRNRSENIEEEDLQDRFVPVTFANSLSREAAKKRAQLFGQRKPKVKPDPDAEQVDIKPFIDIKPKIERMDVDENIASEHPSPPAVVQARPVFVKNLVRTCLMKAKLVSLEEIYQFIRSNMEPQATNSSLNSKDILDALNDLALLVQGNWVVKGEVLYGDSSQREGTCVTGININLFNAARDYLLWLFTQNRSVSRHEYSRKVKIPDYDVKEIFNQLAYLRPDSRQWEFKLPKDDKFLEKYPDVAQRQATFWKVRRANKLSIFG